MPMAAQLMSVPGFITATRSDANNEATFTVNIDLAALLKSPQFASMMGSFASGFGGLSAANPTDQLNKVMPLFENLKITFSTVVGTQDKLFHGFSFHGALNLTPDQLKTLASASGNAATEMPVPTNPVSGDLNLTVRLSNLNQPVNLTAPADAIPAQLQSPAMGVETPEPAATSAQ